MRRPRFHIDVTRPLIFPLILVLCLVVLIEVLNSLSFVDTALVALIRQLPAGLGPVANGLGVIGNFPFLIVVAVAVAAYEFWRRRVVRGVAMLASLMALPLFYLFKEAVRRARPVTDYVASHGLHDFSFPSGHTTGSAAVYGMVAVLIWSNSGSRRARWVSGLLLVLIGLIGVSRVYLGAHFPTDVLGGWLLALLVVSSLRSMTLAIAKRSEGTRAEVMEDTTET